MLCLDWSEDALQVALVGLQKSRPQIQKHWCLKYQDGSLLDADASQVGPWLRRLWKEHGIPDQGVYVALPRRQVVLGSFRQQYLPGVDLAEAILLQAESRYHSQIDDLVVDFLQQPSPGDDDGCAVMTGAVSGAIVQRIKSWLSAASIDLLGLGVGELGLGWLPDGSECDKSRLSILVDDTTVEIVASHVGVPVVAQSLNVPNDRVQRIESLRRLIGHVMTATTDLGFSAPSQVRLFGADHDVQELCAQQVGDVVIEEPKRLPLLRLEGLAATFNRPGTNLDFVAPRRPPDRQAIRRNRLLVATGLIGLVAAGMSAWVYKAHADLDEQLAALKETQRSVEKKLVGSEPTFASAQAVSDWNDSRIDWSDEIHSLLVHVGDNQRCYLQRLQLDSVSGTESASALITGLVRENQDALQIAENLIGDSHDYKVAPGPIRPSKQDPHYKASFDLTVQWESSGEVNNVAE